MRHTVRIATVFACPVLIPGRIAMQHRGNVVKHWHNLCYVTWDQFTNSLETKPAGLVVWSNWSWMRCLSQVRVKPGETYRQPQAASFKLDIRDYP